MTERLYWWHSQIAELEREGYPLTPANVAIVLGATHDESARWIRELREYEANEISSSASADESNQ